MPDNFEIANTFTKAAEGGLTDDPNDRGGITNHGVSLVFLRGLAEKSQANRETLHRMQIRLPITRDVIKTLTPDQATSLFRWQFWNRLHLDDGMPLRMACLLYDAAVNHGRAWGVRLAQRGYNASSQGPRLAEDGILGPLTRAALSSADTPAVHEAILTARRAYYEAIIARDANQACFRRGWMNRIANLRAYVRGL